MTSPRQDDQERERAGTWPAHPPKSRIALAVESVFANLTRPMRTEDRLATAHGLAPRIVRRLCAYLGMLIDTRLGRPSRALVAYGRP
jgi:hypothetical protein